MYNQNNDDKKYCAITEQGDLGLGAEVLNESDQQTMKRADEIQKDGHTIKVIRQIVI